MSTLVQKLRPLFGLKWALCTLYILSLLSASGSVCHPGSKPEDLLSYLLSSCHLANSAFPCVTLSISHGSHVPPLYPGPLWHSPLACLASRSVSLKPFATQKQRGLWQVWVASCPHTESWSVAPRGKAKADSRSGPSFPALEARSLRLTCGQSWFLLNTESTESSETESTSPCLGGSGNPKHRWFVTSSHDSLPPLSHGLLLRFCVCLSPRLHLMWTLVIGFRFHPNPEWSHIDILYLMTSVKTIFSNKVTFTASMWTCLLGNHHSTL